MLKYQLISGAIKVCIIAVMLFATSMVLADSKAPQEAGIQAEQVAEGAAAQVAKPKLEPGYFYAIGGLMGLGCLAAGYAVGQIGSAVMGAAAERPEIMGKAIAFVGLGEGIALFAFLICLMLLMRI